MSDDDAMIDMDSVRVPSKPNTSTSTKPNAQLHQMLDTVLLELDPSSCLTFITSVLEVRSPCQI
jgi:ATP-dependent Clp protease adapter protein ClpS